jgi:hypothetical protein
MFGNYLVKKKFNIFCDILWKKKKSTYLDYLEDYS